MRRREPVAGISGFRPAGRLQAALEKTAGPALYAVTWGAPNFRQALARKQNRFTGLAIDPDAHLVVTCGSTEAMMAATMMTACNPGDKVVVFSPFYENYVADTILSGAEPIYVPLRPPDSRSTPPNCAAPSNSGPRRSFSATRRIRPARCSPATS